MNVASQSVQIHFATSCSISSSRMSWTEGLICSSIVPYVAQPGQIDGAIQAPPGFSWEMVLVG